MAHYAKPIFFLLVVVVFAFLQIEARESMFFTKTIHYNVPQIETPSLAPAPALASQFEILAPALAPELESPAPAPVPVETEYGYGLYGEGADKYPSTKTTSNTTVDDNDENKFSTEELKSQSYKEYNFGNSYNNNNNNNNNGYSTPLSYNNNNDGYSTPSSYNNNNDGYSTPSSYNNNNNNNGYSTPSSYNTNNGYSTSSLYDNNNNNGYSMPSSYNNNNEYSTPSSYNNNNEGYSTPSSYNNNGYTRSYSNNNGNVKNEPQGLSDTRFLNNGKYYYDVKNENYNPNKYESTRASSNNHEGYSGNGENSKYEFDSMEEYDRQQGYPEEYIP